MFPVHRPAAAAAYLLGATLLSLTQFIEGFVADIVRLPVLYFSSHLFVLSRGVAGAYQIERLARRRAPKLLSLRAIAIVNVVLIFAIVDAINKQSDDSFGAFISGVLKPDGIVSPVFARTLAAIIMLYCLYHGALSLLLRRTACSDLFAAVALYFASSSFLLYATYFLVAFAYSGDGFQYELMKYAMRFCILATYFWMFWQIGVAAASRLRFSGLPRPALIVGSGAGCFLIYLTTFKLCLGENFRAFVWPSLAM